MIHPAPYIRKSLVTLLKNAITYGGALVPVGEGEGMAGVPHQILIGEFNYRDISNKHSFTGNCDQLIEVVTELPGSNPTRHADAIGNEIMHLMQPKPRQIGMAPEGFQVIGLKMQSTQAIREQGANNSRIVRLLIRYTFILNQINL